jgi:outer membrane protein assembly factor BamB
MKKILILFLSCACLMADAQEPAIQHRFLAVDFWRGKVYHVDQANPTNNWEMPWGGGVRDLQLVGNNRLLISDNDGYNVYDLGSRKKVDELHNRTFAGVTTARRCADGTTWLGANQGTNVCIYALDATNGITQTITLGSLKWLRMMRFTPNDTLLLAEWDGATEISLQPGLKDSSRILRRFKMPRPRNAYMALAVEDGTTWVAGGYAHGLFQFSQDGTLLREFQAEQPAGFSNYFYAAFQILKNGHIVQANWTGHGAKDFREGWKLIEFDANGKVVWQWHVPKEQAGTINGVLVLDDLDLSVLHDDDGASSPGTNQTSWVGAMEQLRKGSRTPQFRKLAKRFPLEMTWLQEDAGTNLVSEQFGSNLVTRVCDELGDQAVGIRAELAALADIPAGDTRLLELYRKACLMRRQQRLQPLLAKTQELLFVKHLVFASKSGLQNASEYEGDTGPTGLFKLDLRPEAEGRRAEVSALIPGGDGIIRDPCLSYDAKRLLFSWRQGDKKLTTRFEALPKFNYQVFEMELASGRLRQLTSNDTYGASIEPIYLPNGDILFNSSRVVMHITCGWGDTSNMFIMDKDGRFARRVGFDQAGTAYPVVMNDGQVLYMRRDYNDRGQSYAHKLFVMRPDGTQQAEYYGNSSISPTSYQHSRPIPGSSKIMSVIAGYHRSQGGKLGIVDIHKGRQGFEGVSEFPPLRPMSFTPNSGENAYVSEGEQFSYPFPLDETHLLACVAEAQNPRKRFPQKYFYGIYFMTTAGGREWLISDPETHCMQPIPIVERSVPPVLPSLSDWTKTNGIVSMQDVYVGPGLADVPRGTIKKLRIVEIRYKPVTIGSSRGRGPGGGVDSPTPPSLGLGAFDIKAIIGDVPVHEDGSALFTIPARTPVYFQALDKDNQVVQTMRSWLTMMPGEKISCVGCHEAKDTTPMPPPGITQAARAGVQTPVPFYGPTRGFSYPREIQPILDANCVSCHQAGGKAAKWILTGDPVHDPIAQRNWARSFLTLTQAPVVQDETGQWVRGDKDLNWGKPNEIVRWLTRYETLEMKTPYRAGAVKSGLITILRGGHAGVQLSPEALDKLCAWIDLNIPYCGDYDEANAWSEKGRMLFSARMDERRRNEAIDRRNIEALISR